MLAEHLFLWTLSNKIDDNYYIFFMKEINTFVIMGALEEKKQPKILLQYSVQFYHENKVIYFINQRRVCPSFLAGELGTLIDDGLLDTK